MKKHIHILSSSLPQQIRLFQPRLSQPRLSQPRLSQPRLSQLRLSQLRLSCPIHRLPSLMALFLGPHRLHLLFLSRQSGSLYVRRRSLQDPNPQQPHFPQVSGCYLRSVRHIPPCCCNSLPARVRVQKSRNFHLRDLQVTLDPPFDPRLGFLLADGPCSNKTFPRFPSWQECSTLAGDVDVYLNLLPAPQSTSSLPMDISQTEPDRLGMLKDAFSGAERRNTYHRGETTMGEGSLLDSPCSIL